MYCTTFTKKRGNVLFLSVTKSENQRRPVPGISFADSLARKHFLFLSFLLFLYFYYNTIDEKVKPNFKKAIPYTKFNIIFTHLSLLSQNNKELTNIANKYDGIFLTRNSLIFPENKIQMIKIEKIKRYDLL